MDMTNEKGDYDHGAMLDALHQAFQQKAHESKKANKERHNQGQRVRTLAEGFRKWFESAGRKPIDLIIKAGYPSYKYEAGVTREKYIALNLALMEAGVPPAFIPSKQLPPKDKRTEDHTELLRDHQRLDIEWMRLRHRDKWPAKSYKQWYPLLINLEPDQDLLDEFVEKEWTGQKKARSLGVPSSVSKQLRVIRSTNDAARWKKINTDLRDTFPDELARQANHPQSRMKHQDLSVRLIELRVLLGTDSAVEAAKIMLALEGNKTPSEQQRKNAAQRMRDRANNFRRWLGVQVWGQE